MAQFKGLKKYFSLLIHCHTYFFFLYGPMRESDRDVSSILYDSIFTPEPVQQYVPVCFTNGQE